MSKIQISEPTDIYITRKEAAAYLNICLSTLDKLINNINFDGKTHIGRRVLISKQRLDRYIKKDM